MTVCVCVCVCVHAHACEHTCVCMLGECVHRSLCECGCYSVCARKDTHICWVNVCVCVCGLPPATLSTGNDPMFEERVLSIAVQCGDVLVAAVLVE